MATKHFCDICEKEQLLSQLSKLSIASLPGEKYGDTEADVCNKCRDTVLSLFKQFRTTFIAVVAVKDGKEKRGSGTCPRVK